MMGWGLVLLENSSAVAVAAVTAAAVAAAAVAVGEEGEEGGEGEEGRWLAGHEKKVQTFFLDKKFKLFSWILFQRFLDVLK